MEQFLADKDTWNNQTPVKAKLLHGLGGVGKSESAIAFANDYFPDFSFVWTFDCGRDLAIQYKELGEHLSQHYFKNFQISNLTLEEIPEKVCIRLSNLDLPKPWLLIYDNFNKPLPTIKVPERGGYVLITSRREDIWFPQKETKREVGPFEPEEAIKLLQEITEEQNRQEASLLVEDLNRFPFAINLVAHYIKNTPRQSIAKYRELYTQHNKVVDAPMEKDWERDYTHTLKTVWKSTLDDLKEQSPKTIEWLGLCSYLHYNDIPGGWLDQWAESPWVSDRISRDLSNYALMKFNSQNDTYSMHQLMQEVVHLEDAEEKKLGLGHPKYFQRTFHFLKEMGKEAENIDNEPEVIWKKVGSKINKAWFLHFSLLYKKPEILRFSNKIVLIGGIKSLAIYSIYYLNDFNSGRHFSKLGLETSRQMEDEPTQALFLDHLGNAYALARKYKEAEINYQQALKIEQKLLGEESSQVKALRAGLAQTSIYIGKEEGDRERIQNGLSDLEKCLQQLKNEKFNIKIAQYLNTVNHALSFLADIEKDPQKQQKLREQALQKGIEFLELVTKYPLPDPLASIFAHLNIGIDLTTLKRYPEAMNYLQTAEKMMEELNKDSLYMSHVFLRVSQCHYEIGINSKITTEKAQELEAAKNKILKGLNIIYKHLPEDDPRVVDHHCELGKIYAALNNPEQAMEHLNTALKISRKNFDEQHQKVQATLKSIQEVENQINKNKSTSCNIL